MPEIPCLGYGLDVTRVNLASLLLSAALLAGCSHKRVRLPGPVGHLARDEAEADGSPIMTSEAARAEAIAGLTDDPGTGHRRRHSSKEGVDIARQAAKLVGKRSVVVKGESFRRDCSGFVAAAYAGGGFELGGSSKDLYERSKAAGVLHKKKTPEIGDLAFFDNTYDRNKNGRRDDDLTHVAVVEAVADDGTIIMVHYGSKGVARISMDLRDVHSYYDEDGVLRNSILRSGGKGDKLTGELFVAWGSLWKVQGES